MKIHLDEAHREQLPWVEVNGRRYRDSKQRIRCMVHHQYDRAEMLDPRGIYTPEELLYSYTRTYAIKIKLEAWHAATARQHIQDEED